MDLRGEMFFEGGFPRELRDLKILDTGHYGGVWTMPLSKKGAKVKRAMTKTYGKKKGTSVFYASINAGKIKGAHKAKKRGRG